MAAGFRKFLRRVLLPVVACIVPHAAVADPAPPRLLLDNGITISTNEASGGRSYLKKRYPLGQMIDGNPATTWVFEGAKSVVPQIDITLPANTRLRKLVIVNGYAKSRSLYYKNNRIIALSVTNRRDGRTVTYRLKETMARQELTLESGFDGPIAIRVSGLNKGTKFDDTCISELQIVSDRGPLLKANSFILAGGGEYPSYELHRRGRRIGRFESESVADAFFMQNGRYAVFTHAAEIHSPGVTIYNVANGRKRLVLAELMVVPGTLKWHQGRLVGQALEPRTDTNVPFSRRVTLP